MTPRHIFVDKHGRRFVDEKSIEVHAGLLSVDHFDTHALEYPRIPCYAIFDETARRQGPITMFVDGGYAGLSYKWSMDNSVECEKGWILKGNTLAELAGKITGMDVPTLENSVAKWNDDVNRGEDTQLHRPMRAPKREGGPATRTSRPRSGRRPSIHRRFTRFPSTPPFSIPREDPGVIQKRRY